MEVTVVDQGGNVIGHGVDPTGAFVDIASPCDNYHNSSGYYHTFNSRKGISRWSVDFSKISTFFG